MKGHLLGEILSLYNNKNRTYQILCKWQLANTIVKIGRYWLLAKQLTTIICKPSHRGMQSRMFLCLTQARINCNCCSRKGIRRKNGGTNGGGLLISPDECHPPGLSVCLPLVILTNIIKSRRSFLLAPAHPGGPGKRDVKWLWYWCISSFNGCFPAKPGSSNSTLCFLPSLVTEENLLA